jgi:hypothetical protein
MRQRRHKPSVAGFELLPLDVGARTGGLEIDVAADSLVMGHPVGNAPHLVARVEAPASCADAFADEAGAEDRTYSRYE